MPLRASCRVDRDGLPMPYGADFRSRMLYDPVRFLPGELYLSSEDWAVKKKERGK
jgi:hypothetical protein